jgi:2-oxoglutarate ferredoxin oxidoreductase subunit gamma
MRTEIRIAGYGGQGIVLAGVILGEAASRDGFKAVQTQSYGPEARGGAARSEVVISDGLVDYPKVIVPDILVALSQPGFDKYGGDVKEETRIVADADLVQCEDDRLIRVPFLKTSQAVGNKIVANIVMLGYLCAMIEIIPQETLEAAVLAKVPEGTGDLNRKAIAAGRRLFEESGKAEAR